MGVVWRLIFILYEINYKFNEFVMILFYEINLYFQFYIFFDTIVSAHFVPNFVTVGPWEVFNGFCLRGAFHTKFNKVDV